MYLRQARLVMLIGCIEGEQRKLARGDGLAVASHLRIGRSLVSLRELAGPGWAEQAESLGYDRQLASRYVALGDSPLAKDRGGKAIANNPLGPTTLSFNLNFPSGSDVMADFDDILMAGG